MSESEGCAYCLWGRNESHTIVKRINQPAEFIKTHGESVRICKPCLLDLRMSGDVVKKDGSHFYLADLQSQYQF